MLVSANVTHDAATEGALTPGGARATVYSFRLPDGNAGVGDLEFTVTVDVTNPKSEYDGIADAEANNTDAKVQAATIAPYADLQVQDPHVDPADVLQSGQNLTIHWDVKNSGDGATAGSWYDRVVVRNKATGEVLLSRTIPYDPAAQGNGAIDPNGVRSRQTSFTLPDGNAGVGTFEFIVTTDDGGSLFEYNADGSAEMNNTAAIERAATIAPYADLQVQDLHLDPSTGLNSGDALVIRWNDANTGDKATAGSWNDHVQVRNKTTGQILLSQVLTFDGPPSGRSPARVPGLALPFTLPQGNAGAGEIEVTVTADYHNNLYEYNAASTAESNNSAAVTYMVALAAYPDLRVAGITAPAVGVPGQTMSLDWTVVNAGNTTATGSWVERVFLSSDPAVGNDILVAAFGFDNQSIAANSFASRTRSFQLPNNLAPGNWYLVVEVDATNAVIESNEQNNAAVSAAAMAVPVVLTVTTSASQVGEAGPTITGRVTRSGGTGCGILVSLASGDTTEATVPATVTIGATSLWIEFPITPVQDSIVDGNQPVTVTASAPGVAAGSATFTVTDSARPSLTLSYSSPSVTEGGTVTGRVERDPATNGAAVEVTLSANVSNQLSFPSSVTIPAGEDYAEFTITALIDDRVEIDRPIVLTASGFGTTTAALLLIDANDARLTVTIDAPEVSEGAIGVATLGTVTRPVITNRSVRVKLDADPSRLIVPAFVTIPAGQASARFEIATVDNTTSGDSATLAIRARPVDAVDGSTPVEPGGSAALSVVDDDAPGLTVTILDVLISEGDNIPPRHTIPAALGVVRRNSADTSTTLLVYLTSGDTTEATVPATVTIPVGASSVEFGIFAVYDGVSDGTQVVTISAAAAGFNTGRAYIAVSDIDKPDLRVIDASAPTTALTGQSVTLFYTNFNQGPQPVMSGWVDRTTCPTTRSSTTPPTCC